MEYFTAGVSVHNIFLRNIFFNAYSFVEKLLANSCMFRNMDSHPPYLFIWFFFNLQENKYIYIDNYSKI